MVLNHLQQAIENAAESEGRTGHRRARADVRQGARPPAGRDQRLQPHGLGLMRADQAIHQARFDRRSDRGDRAAQGR
jgi:hypothetical protein